jgi:hypothetical protein
MFNPENPELVILQLRQFAEIFEESSVAFNADVPFDQAALPESQKIARIVVKAKSAIGNSGLRR